MIRELCAQLDAPPVSVRVLARRPSDEASELHGYYETEEGKRPVIRVWMKTAANKRTVAFRTFLRTLLHEFLHHHDFFVAGYAESFHTEGFFRRESHLMRACAPPRAARSDDTDTARAANNDSRARRRREAHPARAHNASARALTQLSFDFAARPRD